MAKDGYSTEISSKGLSWWKQEKSEQYKYIFEAVSVIWSNGGDRAERNLRCMRLYGNSDYAGIAPYSVSKSIMPTLPENRVKVNVITSMADTVSAKISKIRPRVSFLTTGGDYKLQTDAKKLSQFTEGLFYRNDIYRLHQAAFKDSTVLDVGALKHYIDGDNICTERVLANELFVEEVDGMYGCPRTIYQMKFIHKDILKQLFPKKIASITQASNTLSLHITSPSSTKDYAVVIEAWHLPSTKDAGDGRHVICTDKGELFSEKFERDYFPFTFFKWSTRLTGFWGQSLADRLTGNQIEINKMLRIIQKSFHLGSTFKVFLEHGSKIAKEHLNNEIGAIVYYTGSKPEYYVPKTVHEEYFKHLDFLIKSSYEEAGVSQLSASSRKPAGLDSGKALREFDDIETERFAIVSQEYERTFLETAKQYIDLVKEMHEDGVDLEVTAESKKFIEKIKWSDINVKDNDFVMNMFPVSMLPHTPAGRIQMVQELVNDGFIPREFATKLLDFPDLDSYTSLLNAPLDDLIETIEDMLANGKYTPPEPYQDLGTGIRLGQSYYLRGKKDKVPDDRLDLLRRWMSQAQVMMDKAASAQQVPAGAPQTGVQVAPQGPTIAAHELIKQ